MRAGAAVSSGRSSRSAHSRVAVPLGGRDRAGGGGAARAGPQRLL